MKDLCALLFELSNEDRLSILSEIERKPQKMTHLAKRFKWTVQETSRNLTRLETALLIVKDRNGDFRLSPYGDAALTLLRGYEFVSRNRDYFSSHTLSKLPQEWKDGLGALSTCSRSDDVMMLFHNAENMIRNAKKYIWILTDQVLASTIPLLSEAVGRGIEFRLILPRNPTVPDSVVEMCSKDPTLMRAGQKGLAQSRFLESVDAVISVSEREVGILSFPMIDGKLDYRGFYSANDAPRSWCTSLFSRYWTGSSNEVPASLRGLL